MSFEGGAVGLFSGEFSDGFVFTAEIAGGAGAELGSHLGPSRPGLALDLAGDRLVLTADTARAYPSESLLALEDVAGTLPPLRGAEIVANSVEGFGAGDIDVSADRLALDFGGIRVDAGGRIEIRVDFAISREEAQTLALLYEAALDRDGDVDAPGLNFWIDRREDGLSLRDIADRFLTAAEFTARFGPIESLSAEQYVDRLYQNVLGRQGEAEGFAFWTGVASRPDADRAQILLRFAESDENRAANPFIQELEEVVPGLWDFV